MLKYAWLKLTSDALASSAMPPSVCSKHWASFRKSKYSNCSSSRIGADVQVVVPSL